MRDQEVILAEGLRGLGEDGGRASHEVWESEGARESVGLWLARNTKAH
jgi:SWI/SNF-related matrix-associated actin-dependent regulator of chromatin subfamily D